MTVFVKSLLYLLIISDINIDKVINYKTAVTAIFFFNRSYGCYIYMN